MRRWIVTASALAVGCSPALRRPVETTEAAGRLEQVTVSNDNELDPAVSPDAKALAYEVAAAPGAPSRVEVMSLENLGVTAPRDALFSSPEAIGREPTWLPDGHAVVFVSSEAPDGRLVEMIGEGHGRRAFVAGTGDLFFAGEWPAIAPDGASVATSLGRLDTFGGDWPRPHHYEGALGLSDLVGSGVRPIGLGFEPAWSPDGKRLAFVRRVGGRAHVFVAAADGSGATQITDGASDDLQPAWSPDGRSLAFCAAQAVSGVPHANLFVVGADGENLVQLTEGDRFACRPSWGRDGFIYFHANVTDRFHIWRLLPV